MQRQTLILHLRKVCHVSLTVSLCWACSHRVLRVPKVDQHQHSVEITTEYWKEYRISDGIARSYSAPGCEKYPNSIVCEYHHETEEPRDIKALTRVLDRYSNQNTHIELADRQSIVVHLRLGDGLCARIDPTCRGTVTSVPNCWEHDDDCFRNPDSETKHYAYSKAWYLPLLYELEAFQDRYVVIVSDFTHWTRTSDPREGNYTVDEVYAQNVYNFFSEHGFDVKMKRTGTPDADFVYMCSSAVFLQGGGGYSNLVASVVRERGRIVLQPKRTPSM